MEEEMLQAVRDDLHPERQQRARPRPVPPVIEKRGRQDSDAIDGQRIGRIQSQQSPSAEPRRENIVKPRAGVVELRTDMVPPVLVTRGDEVPKSVTMAGQGGAEHVPPLARK